MPKTFLVIDADADGRVLIVGTLLRVFPDAAVVECQDAGTALRHVKGHMYDAVISHRAIGTDPESLVRAIRGENADVPLLAVSRNDRREELVAAGATQFLNYEEWLMLGRTILGMMPSPQPNAPSIPRSLPRIAGTGLTA